MASSQATNRSPHPFVRGLQFFYLLIVWLFALCVAIQTYFAGLGIFVKATWFEVHTALGWLLFLSVFSLPVLAALGRFPRAILLLSIFLVCDVFLQAGSVTFMTPLGYPALTAFHVTNALILFLVAVLLAFQAHRWVGKKREIQTERG